MPCVTIKWPKNTVVSTDELKDTGMKFAERETMSKHIKEMKKNDLTVKVIECATKDDVLAVFGGSEAKMIYISGHGYEFSVMSLVLK